MECRAITELLPWLLNGTLEPGDHQRVSAHLHFCAECRQELREMYLAWNTFGAHVPASVLVDYAFKRPIASFDEQLIERHLTDCEECRVEFEMTQESWRWANEDLDSGLNDIIGAPPALVEKRNWWDVGYWRRPALGAALIVIIAFGGWLWNLSQARAREGLISQKRVISERLASLEAENQSLRQTETQLRRQLDGANQQITQLDEKVKELNAPQLNSPVLDVHPAELLQRKSGDQAANHDVNELAIPADAKLATLILNSQNPDAYQSYSIEMLDHQNKVIWSETGLMRSPSNDYTVSLRAESLAPGASYTINVYGVSKGRRVKVESYRIRVRRSATR